MTIPNKRSLDPSSDSIYVMIPSWSLKHGRLPGRGPQTGVPGYPNPSPENLQGTKTPVVSDTYQFEHLGHLYQFVSISRHFNTRFSIHFFQTTTHYNYCGWFPLSINFLESNISFWKVFSRPCDKVPLKFFPDHTSATRRQSPSLESVWRWPTMKSCNLASRWHFSPWKADLDLVLNISIYI